MRYLTSLLVAVILVGCMPTKEEIWDPRDYDLSCEELRNAIGRSVDDDIEAKRMQAMGYGGMVVGPAAVAVAAPMAIAAAPVLVVGAAAAGTYAILKGTDSKREAERRREHLERIYFSKGCVSGAKSTDAVEESAAGTPPDE